MLVFMRHAKLTILRAVSKALSCFAQGLSTRGWQVVVIAEADYFAPQSATMAAMEQAHAQVRAASCAVLQ